MRLGFKSASERSQAVTNASLRMSSTTLRMQWAWGPQAAELLTSPPGTMPNPPAAFSSVHSAASPWVVIERETDHQAIAAGVSLKRQNPHAASLGGMACTVPSLHLLPCHVLLEDVFLPEDLRGPAQ